jgi:hypothetical protein
VEECAGGYGEERWRESRWCEAFLNSHLYTLYMWIHADGWYYQYRHVHALSRDAGEYVCDILG